MLELIIATIFVSSAILRESRQSSESSSDEDSSSSDSSDNSGGSYDSGNIPDRSSDFDVSESAGDAFRGVFGDDNIES